MIEALRGLGYSTATALADIIDNSIAAHASQVDIMFSWSGYSSTIGVLDNGTGMSDHELELAMRLGDRNPLEMRAIDDLGRFGLGLKTASFSQCRRLTVASRKAQETSCLRWDLDVIAASKDDGWYLLEGPSIGSEHLLLPLDSKSSGTIIVWENLGGGAALFSPACVTLDDRPGGSLGRDAARPQTIRKTTRLGLRARARGHHCRAHARR